MLEAPAPKLEYLSLKINFKTYKNLILHFNNQKVLPTLTLQRQPLKRIDECTNLGIKKLGSSHSLVSQELLEQIFF